MKKRDYKAEFDGSNRLFEACWRRYLRARRFLEIDDVSTFLDDMAAGLVNDSNSSFYIYGR